MSKQYHVYTFDIRELVADHVVGDNDPEDVEVDELGLADDLEVLRVKVEWTDGDEDE